MGLNSTLIQPFGYLSIIPPLTFVKIMDKKINDLLSFSVFFVINELVGLELNRKFQERGSGGKVCSIRKQSTTVE